MAKTRAAPQGAASPAAQPAAPPSVSSADPSADADPLEHVLDNVLLAGGTSPFRLAFDAAGIEDIDDLLSLSPKDIKDISWTDASGATVSLKVAQSNTIISLIQWYGAQGTTDPAVFLELDKAGLSAFRRAIAATPPTAPGGISMPPSTPARGGPYSPPTPYSALSPADEFKRGIKRDVNAFQTFKDRRQWNQWHRSFVATAHSQGLGNVLDPDYTPSTPSEQALFDLLQSHTFAVFTSHLREPEASEIVRKYTGKSADDDKRHNAQLLYQELLQTMTGGMAGSTRRTTLEESLQKLRLDSNWNKSIVSFLTTFSHLIQDLRELRDDDDFTSYDDAWCIRALKTCLSTHDKMSQYVQTSEATNQTLIQQLSALGISPPSSKSYADYFTTIKAYATSLDAKHKGVRRQANSSSTRGGRGGRSPGRGSGRSSNRSGSGGRSFHRPPAGNGRDLQGVTDPTDPKIYLSDTQWRLLSRDQQNRRKARQAEYRANQSVQAPTSAPTVVSHPAPPASSVAVPSYADAASVASSLPAASLPPGSLLRHAMSSSAARAPAPASSSSSPASSGETLTINGVTYRRACATSIYRVNNQALAPSNDGSLVDGGANGGLLRRSDARILEWDHVNTVDVVGVTADSLSSLPTVQAAAKVETVTDGPIIAIFSNYAARDEADNGRTIHSKGQLESFGLLVDDRPQSSGGTQCVITNEGYVIPLHIRDGLPYMDMSPPTDSDMDTFPHVFMTSDSPWDPTALDSEFSVDPVNPLPDSAIARRQNRDPRVNDFGDYVPPQQRLNHSTCVDQLLLSAASVVTTLVVMSATVLSHFPTQLRPRLPDLDFLRPNFAWVPSERIKATLDATTQFYRATIHHPFRKHFKSRFPAANVRRIPEWFSTDTFFSDVPAHDDGIPGHGGCTMVQIFGGLDSEFLHGTPLASESQMHHAFEDFIRSNGAPVGIMSDNAKSELSARILDLLRLYAVRDRQSEPHYQHQNPIERRIQDLKRMVRNTMDHTGTPAKFWLLCLFFIIGLCNVLVNSKGQIPLSVMTNQVTDVSAYLQFHWWQEVFFEQPDKSECLGRWVGVAQDKGDALTYFVLTHDTQQVVVRSNVRPAKDPLFPNPSARPSPDSGSLTAGGEAARSTPVLMSLSDIDPAALELPKYSPEELLGLTFLRETEDGDKIRAKIVRKIMDRDAQNHQNIKFLISVGDDAYEEIIAYNELSDIVQQQHEAEASGELDVWTFNDVIDHQGPLSTSHPNYNGSSYNVKVKWTDGSETWEPLSIVMADDPVTLAAYAKEHDLLDTPGWKRCKRLARRAKVLQRMLNQSRRRSKASAVRYKFGVQIPRNAREAYRLDKENGNTLWADAIAAEIGQLNDYSTFEDLGKNNPTPPGHIHIMCHFVFDCMETGRRKARFVAGGHLTAPPKDSVYSSVASLRSIRMVAFLAELNGLNLSAADVGNAYLEANTKERITFTAGEEFGPLQGHTLAIRKALYGLRSSGARFHEKFADTLRAMGFSPSYADPDVWLRDAGDCYEYVCVYVDDLLVALKDPDKFMEALQSDPWNYKLKGVGPPRYHLGGDFFRDSDNTLCYSTRTYVERLVSNFKILFGEDPPKRVFTPLPKGDHPELDESPLCSPDQTAKFQSIVGALQWTISLCRFDIANAVMTLSRFRAEPRIGHLDRAKKIVSYLAKYPHGAIRFRTSIPDHESVFGEHPERHDWMHSVYGSPKEQVLPGLPPPKGKMVRTTTYVDANLMHDAVTGRSATGIIHMFNQTPIDWFSKRQGQVETATYGSEFVAARTATEQIMDLRFTLRSLGVPVDDSSWMFGDNQAVITSSTIPHSQLSKRWNALSYHRVREAVAAGFIRFHYLHSKQNPSDIMTKPLDRDTAWPFVEPLLFWKGDTLSSRSEGSVERAIETVG